MEVKKNGKILVIDDNEDVLFALNLLLKPLVEDIRVAKNPEQIDRFYDLLHPDVVLLDMNFTRDAISGEEGFEWLEHILHRDAQAVVILMTAYADADKAVRALKSGATDFITKPWDNSKLLATLFAGVELSQERHKNRLLEQRMEVAAATEAPTLIGESPVMQRVMQTVEQVAPTDANVLILGENGTGKDVIARQLCALSHRAAKPFVSIDLGSVPEQLFESELFGYEKGAFTDARKAKAGRMETASGGTLFLDEIGDMSLAAQTKVLRALQENEITRVGSDKAIKVNVRVLAATNKDLDKEIAAGTFREDLFHRLNVIPIHVPSLNERTEDIPLLVSYFAEQICAEQGIAQKRFDADAIKAMQSKEWTGNIRQLRNVVERLIILAGNEITKEDVDLYA
jgi:DNA-binding NtrC family response regulator